MNTEDHIALMDKFLKNELSDGELVRFNTLMKDEKFNREFEEHKHAVAWIKASQKAELKKELKEIFNDSSKARKDKTTSLRRFSFSRVAASILIISIIGYLLYQWLAPSDFYSKYYTVYSVTTVRGTNEGPIQQALTAYQNKAYVAASKQFVNLLKGEETNDEWYLYLGNCYLQLEEWQVALDAFQKAEQSSDKLIGYHGKWYQALVYLKLGQPKESRRLLQDLADNSPYQKEAADLLKDIEDH